MSSKKWLVSWFAGLALVFVAAIPFTIAENHRGASTAPSQEQIDCSERGGWYWDATKGCMPEESREAWSAPPVPTPSEAPTEPSTTAEGQDTGHSPVVVHKDGDDDHWNCRHFVHCRWHW